MHRVYSTFLILLSLSLKVPYLTSSQFTDYFAIFYMTRLLTVSQYKELRFHHNDRFVMKLLNDPRHGIVDADVNSSHANV